MLRTLGNVAYKGTAFCLQLVEAGVLPALCATLKMADAEVVTLSLEVLHLLVASSPQVGQGANQHQILQWLSSNQDSAVGADVWHNVKTSETLLLGNCREQMCTV